MAADIAPTAPLGIARRAARAVGGATAAWRPLPDFLLIGTKRGGTTSFYFDLIAHPNIVRLFPPPVPGLKENATKGVHYFDSNYERSEQWYRSYMPTALSRRLVGARQGGRVVTGEASPYYLFHPDAARRAHATVPEARILVLLRDPVERTYSHWKERRRSDAEPLSFSEALDAEPGRLAGECARLLAEPQHRSYAWEQQSYVQQSLYADALRPWIDRFGRNHVLVLASEDYYASPVTALGETDAFLGLAPRATSSGVRRNAAPGSELDDEVRARLQETFRGPNEELVRLTGRSFPWG